MPPIPNWRDRNSPDLSWGVTSAEPGPPWTTAGRFTAWMAGKIGSSSDVVETVQDGGLRDSGDVLASVVGKTVMH
jgi:hypothetical protein